VVCTVCPLYAFCNSHCLHMYFLVSRPGIVALCVYRASNVYGDECSGTCLVLQLESAEHLERRRAALNEAGRTVSVNVHEGTYIPRVELNTVHL
jgi:hypothetical protein